MISIKFNAPYAFYMSVEKEAIKDKAKRKKFKRLAAKALAKSLIENNAINIFSQRNMYNDSIDLAFYIDTTKKRFDVNEFSI